jgi:hypothetical protein
MSGIIGGAGSKSGVIGVTELDYEEGKSAIGFSVGSASTAYWKWIRVGQLVTIFAQIDGATGTSGGAISLTGLPFTAVGPHDTGHAGHGAVSYASSMGNKVCAAVASTNNTTVFIANHDATTVQYADCSSGWNIRFAISYRCYPTNL